MRKTSDQKQSTLQQKWCIYLIVNIVFLIPVFVLTQFPDAVTAVFEPIPEPFGLIFLIYWLPVILYFLLGLPYLHFAAESGFLIFAGYRMIKEKNAKIFLLILVLTALSAALNIYWLMHGRSYTIV